MDELPLDITMGGEGCTVKVLVAPKASKSEVAGVIEGVLKIRISAPPVDGAANKELVRFLSKQLGVSKSSVLIRSGLASKRKSVFIRGVGAKDIVALAGKT
jgi:hypothetical protein